MKRRRRLWPGIVAFVFLAGIISAYFLRERIDLQEVFRGVFSGFADNLTEHASGNLKVHFLDVGQADCILIQSGGENMLIDAGNNDDAGYILSYLRAQDVRRLDYVIATHAHEDHIGAMDDIIYNFEIGELFLPAQMYDTRSFAEVLEAAEKEKVEVVHPGFKETAYLGGSRFIFVMPDADGEYEDLNDSSLGIRITNGTHSFLMCGDSSMNLEKELIDSRIYLQSDVYKVSHHGSSDANSAEFLKKVDPEYAVILCEKGNDYGHPHKKTLKRLKKAGARIFRTDEQGDIVFESDGETLMCNVNPTE